jgi:hypothetical protein
MGVGGCWWPSSSNINRWILPSLQLRNKPPNSASAAEATTNFKIPQKTSIAPLSFIGASSVGTLPKK